MSELTPPRRASHGIGLGLAPASTSSAARRPSAPVISPPRQPAIPRSTSVTASIDFFESKSRSSTPPRPGTTPAKKDDPAQTQTPGSPKPAGPRTMSPPSQGGRRLSYRPPSDHGGPGEGTVRRSLEDPRRGLGINVDTGRRVSEASIAGPSRIVPRGSGNSGPSAPMPERMSHGLSRSGSGKGKERASSYSAQGAPLARRTSSSRRDRPVLRPRQPSDRPHPTSPGGISQAKPAIRIVQPTPSSHARRRTSAPPESPITPTRSRALSPTAASSSSSQQSLASTSSPRSIRPGSRRTSYQLAKPASSDGASAKGSIISEFGVLGASKLSPRLGRFVESLDDGDVPSPRRRLAAVDASPQIPLDTGSPLLDTSPFIIQHANGSRTGDGSAFSSSEATSPTTSRTSSYVSAKSPSSPIPDRPLIPARTSSASLGSPPSISKRTSSIDGGIGSPNRSPYTEQPGQMLQQFASRSGSLLGLEDRPGASEGTNTRRASEVTAVGRLSMEGFPHDHPDEDLTPPSVLTPTLGPAITPNAQLPTTSPRRDRKSPGLTIDPSPPPRPPRDSARPSPPIPAKSPLRRLTPQHPSLPDLRESRSEGRSPRVRDGSGESALATASTMNDSFETAPLPSDSEASSPALQPGDTVPYPASYESGHTADEEIRFTMLTVPSAYSQDSAPSTARTIPDSEWSGASGRTTDRSGSGSFGWGRQRHSIISMDGSLSGVEDAFNRPASLPRLRISSTDTGKSLPETPRETPSTAATTSSASHDVVTGHSPLSPVRSPSMPVMNTAFETPRKATVASRLSSATSPRLGEVEAHATPKAKSGMTRSQTTPLVNLAAPTPSSSTALSSKPAASVPTSPVVSGSASKRAHLVREIVSTERNYANDLALIRDAYLLRYIRPASGVSTVDSTAAPSSETSRRSSIYTYQTAETKRSSGHEYPTPLLLPHQKSPAAIGDGGSTSYFPGGMTASASTSSLAVAAAAGAGSGQGILRATSGASSTGNMAPPIGKPLSPADVRTVFLNLGQLAAAAEEMATAMEAAIGDDGLPPTGRDGETGNDKLGEVFVNLVPMFRPLYSFYCARQSTASARLLELLADPAHATFLNDCWSLVKPHTHAWNLDSMLIKPVQRITKYPLLFEDLLACTTPVHADYFHIRNAAVMARSVAQEIDETKRRKDVVAGVISKKAVKTAKMSNDGAGAVGRPKGLKLFRKEKSTSSVPPGNSNNITHSTTTVNLLMPTGNGGAGGSGPDSSVPEITKASLAHFKELVNRVDQCEQCVRRVGKEVILWTAAAKDCSMIQDGLVKAWLGVVTLDGQDGPDPKMVWFRKVIAGVVSDAWRALNDEVQDQIMPALSKLLESGVNPRKVISKRDLKAPDYARYFSLAESKKPIDRAILQSARDFVALHTQLVEELPLFLEGYMRIFDLAICAFSAAQAGYHAKVHERMGDYVREHLDGVKRSPKVTQGGPGLAVAGGSSSAGTADLGSIAGIVRYWSDAWTPYAEAVDHFQCTKPARQAATRIASFQDRPGSHSHSHARTHSRQNSTHSRTGSRSNSPLPPASPSRPTTPRSPTFLTSHHRQRSTSLMGPPPLPSPTKEKSESRLFGGFSRPSKSPNMGLNGGMVKSATSTGTATGGTGPTRGGSPMKDIPRLRSSSPVDPAIRNSFGLPTISPDNGKFGALGWSPIKPVSPSLRNASDPTYPYSNSNGKKSHSRNGSTSSLSSNPGLGFGFTSTNALAPGAGAGAGPSYGVAGLLRRRSSGRSRQSSSESSSKSDRRRKAMSMVSAMEVMSPSPSAAEVGLSSTAASASASRSTSKSRVRPEHQAAKSEVDAADGWRGERVLYQCACVAAFDPAQHGKRRYRGLDFLPMTVGDLFDILHEVGRIDELHSFPFPEVGVDNDGVLVAQAENGDIGLVICSFLEPLT